jgi:hypothetical protein
MSSIDHMVGEELYGLYVRVADELAGTSFARSELFRSFSINFKATRTDQGFPLEIRMTEPDPDALRSYIMVLRHFIAEKEPTNFHRVTNTAVRGHPSETLKGIVKRLRRDFIQQFHAPAFPFSINQHPITAETVRRLFFNSTYFHLDSDKIKALESLKGTPAEPIMRYLFVTTCINLFPPIMNLGIALRIREDELALTRFFDSLVQH